MARQRKHPPIKVGDTFGSWTVTGEEIMDKVNGRSRAKHPARCGCGYTALVPRGNLVGGLSKCCRACAIGNMRAALNKHKQELELKATQQAAPDEKPKSPMSTSVHGDKFGRILPANRTDWSLFNELVRVHRSVITGSQGNTRDLYEWWARWNRIYFQESLKPLFIYTGNTDYGKYLGFCRYFPNREILIQQQGIKSLPIGRRHGVAKRHETFTDLSETHYCIALILLHEMIHQACFEAGVNPSHEGEPWAAHCNAIGMDLGLRLTFSATKRGKQPAAMGQTTRANVWKATSTTLLEGTDRLATHDECRSFPWRSDDPFIAANTMEVMKRDSIAPVQVLPKF